MPPEHFSVPDPVEREDLRKEIIGTKGRDAMRKETMGEGLGPLGSTRTM